MNRLGISELILINLNIYSNIYVSIYTLYRYANIKCYKCINNTLMNDDRKIKKRKWRKMRASISFRLFLSNNERLAFQHFHLYFVFFYIFAIENTQKHRNFDEGRTASPFRYNANQFTHSSICKYTEYQTVSCKTCGAEKNVTN